MEVQDDVKQFYELIKFDKMLNPVEETKLDVPELI